MNIHGRKGGWMDDRVDGQTDEGTEISLFMLYI